MIISANLKEGYTTKAITLDIPTISNPMLPVSYVDPRWIRPYVFQNFSKYVFSEATDVPNDFVRLVNYVNIHSSSNKMDRFKAGLLDLVDEHIRNKGRLVFTDLLMYIDCLAYLSYAANLMTADQIRSNYAEWAEYVIANRRNYIKAATRWGPSEFSGSNNEADLNMAK